MEAQSDFMNKLHAYMEAENANLVAYCGDMRESLQKRQSHDLDEKIDSANLMLLQIRSSGTESLNELTWQQRTRHDQMINHTLAKHSELLRRIRDEEMHCIQQSLEAQHDLIKHFEAERTVLLDESAESFRNESVVQSEVDSLRQFTDLRDWYVLLCHDHLFSYHVCNSYIVYRYFLIWDDFLTISDRLLNLIFI